MKLGERAALSADKHKAAAAGRASPTAPTARVHTLAACGGASTICYACRRKWSPRRGSLLEGLRLPPGKFLLALKLFELEVSARRAARELSLAYNTVHRLFLSGQQPGRPAFGRGRDGRALRWWSSSGQAGAWGFGQVAGVWDAGAGRQGEGGSGTGRVGRLPPAVRCYGRRFGRSGGAV